MEEVYEFLEAKNIDIINIPEAQDDDDEFLDHPGRRKLNLHG